MSAAIRVGTAGWSLPAAVRPSFPGDGSLLERYAARFPCAEINSSFYRPHRPSTYARWAASVPAGFRFAVKVPKAITHERQLADADELIDAFLGTARALGSALGPLLVQLAPKHAFDAVVAERFFTALRGRFAGPVALEPRHPSWFDADATALIAAHGVSRVAADPARSPAGAQPGGDTSLVYYRLHGSPRIYWSSYDDAYLDALAPALRDHANRGAEAWCIFDNTASGAAAANALALLDRL